MDRQPHVITDQIAFGEGPVWCPDGTVVCTSISDGLLYKVWPDSGRVDQLADTGGGPNGAILGSDGSIVVANNGGIDLKAMGRVSDQPPVRYVTPSLQWARLDGSIEQLTTEAMQAPNDLAVDAQGTIFFTDPGEYPGTDVARVMSYALDGSTRVVGDGFRYTNGIAFDPDGTSFVVIEDDVVLARWHDRGEGEREIVIDHIDDQGGDGLALDVEGRYYIACKRSNCVTVFDKGGSRLEVLPLPAGEGALVTNVCFGGDDMRSLFAIDSHRRLMVVWDDMPAEGLPLVTWPTP